MNTVAFFIRNKGVTIVEKIGFSLTVFDWIFITLCAMRERSKSCCVCCAEKNVVFFSNKCFKTINTA
jgi:hypothetical protein